MASKTFNEVVRRLTETLPAGYELLLRIEHGEIAVLLLDEEGEIQTFDPTGHGLTEGAVLEACDVALALGPAVQVSETPNG